MYFFYNTHMLSNTISENPFISICIPTYESNEILLIGLKQIQAQTFSNFEVIISDDSRTDRVKSIVKEFCEDKRFYYHKNEVGLGSPENWNKAISLSRGKYIKIMHHDDYFTSLDSLEKMVKLLNGGAFDFVFCGTLVKNSAAGKEWTVYITKFIASLIRKWPEIMLFSNFIGAPSVVLFKKTENLKFDTKTKWLVDLDFYISYIKKSKKINYTKETLVCITTDETTTVTSHVRNDKKLQLFEYFYVYSEHKSKNYFVKFFQLRALDKILCKFKVLDASEIFESNFQGSIPLISRLRILLNRFLARFKV